MATENKQRTTAKVACIIVLAIIMFFFASIVVRTFTRQILEKRMGIRNSFTDTVLYDVQDIYDEADHNITARGDTSGINWEALYPFQDESLEISEYQETPISKQSILNSYEGAVMSLEDAIDTYVTDYLLGYKKIVSFANKYESLIQWSYTLYAEYNGVIKLPDGYLTSYIEKKDVTLAAEKTIVLAEFCKKYDINILYIQAPYKISKTQDSVISGVLDFSNQNADAFIKRIKAENVDAYDLREEIEAEGLDHHSLFYRTDHHWLPETGLWAARHILEHLRQQYGYDVNPSLLDPENFTSVLYPSWFLGSQGKQVTLSVTEPDDFSLLYPKYDTKLHFSTPEKNVHLDGDFSIVYDMRCVEEKDYYKLSPYGAYMYGDNALAQFENLLTSNNVRLLFIHDSFGDCVLPFVSLGVQYVDSLDLRHFTGSVESFIERTNPDVVILLYNPSAMVNPTGQEMISHKALFDFR